MHSLADDMFIAIICQQCDPDIGMGQRKMLRGFQPLCARLRHFNDGCVGLISVYQRLCIQSVTNLAGNLEGMNALQLLM